MSRKKNTVIFSTGFLLTIIFLSFISISSNNISLNQDNLEDVRISTDFVGMDDIIVTNITRIADLDGYGMVFIEDTIEFKNEFTNPISSVYVGIPSYDSDDLVYYKATNSDETSSLLVERSFQVSNGTELLVIYLDSPLLPNQKTTIKFFQSFKDKLFYYPYNDGGTNLNVITYLGPVFPLLPYKADISSGGSITALYNAPSGSTVNTAEPSDWSQISGTQITYDLSDYPALYLDPFLENLEADQNITIQIIEPVKSNVVINEITRDIYISPWGIIDVVETVEIENQGYVSIYDIILNTPNDISEVSVSDDLGELIGVENYDGGVTIHLLKPNTNQVANRAALGPGTKIKFYLKYNLPFMNYFSANWFQESIQMDLMPINYDFLIKEQTINLKISGCYSIDYNSIPPDGIYDSKGVTTLVYTSDYVSPIQSKFILFTFTISIFDLILRPMIFTILIIIVASSFVVITKTKKKKSISAAYAKETLPIKEIREFCSFYEEKNAFLLEIRATEEAVKKKKITKKKYKGIFDKNMKRIEEIEHQIIPYKKIVISAGPLFETIINKIDILDAERVSIKDGINLLNSRYRAGKLPSKAAYEKLKDNFLKRRRKIDRNYDKLIQQLRSYLI